MQIISRLEEEIKSNCKFELLEMHYLPYSFGSGTTVYRLKGRNLKVNFDGRNRVIDVKLSPKHEKHSTDKGDTIFDGTTSAFFDNGITLIINAL